MWPTLGENEIRYFLQLSRFLSMVQFSRYILNDVEHPQARCSTFARKYLKTCLRVDGAKCGAIWFFASAWKMPEYYRKTWRPVIDRYKFRS